MRPAKLDFVRKQMVWWVVFISLFALQDCRPPVRAERRGEAAIKLFYVSVAGDDRWSGELPSPNAARTDGPLASVNQAALLSKAHKDVAVTVVIEEGRYYLSSSLNLDSSFSRTPNAPLTFTGCPQDCNDEESDVVEDPTRFPVLSGGIRLTNYTLLPDGTYSIHLPPHLVGIDVTQLFVNGQREPVARKPNQGYLYWKAPIAPCNGRKEPRATTSHKWKAATLDDGPCPDIDRFGFVFNNGDISKKWANPGEAWILVFAAWTASWHHIKSIDFDNNTVLFTEPSDYAVGEFLEASGRRYYIENVREELDFAGEWYYDKTNGRITYLARDKMPEAMEFVIPLQGTAIALNQVANVNFECLSIQHSLEGTDGRQAYHTTEGSVIIFASSHIRFSKCDFQHAGACCIVVGQQSTLITVEQSRIADCGGDGIAMDETSSHVAIQNNIVNTTGFIYMMQPTGIRAQGQRNITVEHNEVLNVPYAATMFGWQSGFPWVPAPSPDHYVFTVRYNLLHYYGLGILNDFGGVYVSADAACWAQPPSASRPSCNMATRVEQNIMHDADCFNYGGDGMYTDENAEGIDLVSNLVYDVNAAGVSLHCGINLTSTNNFFINADYAGYRGVISACNLAGFSKQLPINATFRHNIVFMIERRSHFIMPGTQLGNSTFNQNLYYDASRPFVFASNASFQQWQASGQDKDSKIADPKFVSVEKRNFRLTADSPAHNMGIAPIDIDSVGPKSNPFATQPLLYAWTPLAALQRPGKTKNT